MSKNKKNISAIKRRNFIKNNSILLIVLGVLFILGAFTFLGASSDKDDGIYGDDVVEMHFFHLSTCPHCHKQIEYHKVLLEKYPTLKIIEYEISSQASRDAYSSFATREVFEGRVDPQRISTPTTFIGDEVNVGYGTDETSGVILEEMIEKRIQEIEENWDESTMIRTADLRAQIEASN